VAIKPKLTIFDTTMIVVSLVIGIGIFRTPALVAASTRSTELFFAAWVLGGLISFIGALTFAEIGSRFTEPGAFYKVVADCYHPSAAFMLNWTNVIIVNVAGAAAVATIGAEYLNPIILPSDLRTPLAVQLTAAGLTLFLLVINYLGIKTGAWAQNILTVIKIGMILMLAGVAFGYRGFIAPISQASPPAGSVWAGFAAGLVSVFYTYGGYQCTLNFGADIKSARRIMPKAIFMGIIIIICLYLVINAAYYRVLGIGGIADTKLVAAGIARICFGESAYLVVSVAIFFSAMGFLNVTLMQIPRTYFAMAEKGALPPIFMKVNEKTQAQEFTLLFYGGMILISIFLLGTFEKALNYVMFFDSMNNALVASTIFTLRRRAVSSGTLYDGYKVPFYPFLPVFFLIFLLGITVNVFITQYDSIYVGIIIFAAGYPIYHILKWLTKSKLEKI